VGNLIILDCKQGNRIKIFTKYRPWWSEKFL